VLPASVRESYRPADAAFAEAVYGSRGDLDATDKAAVLDRFKKDGFG